MAPVVPELALVGVEPQLVLVPELALVAVESQPVPELGSVVVAPEPVVVEVGEPQ